MGRDPGYTTTNMTAKLVTIEELLMTTTLTTNHEYQRHTTKDLIRGNQRPPTQLQQHSHNIVTKFL